MSDELPPGWYPDPMDPGRHRWWDGSRWMAKVTPAGPPAARRSARRPVTGRPVWVTVSLVLGTLLGVTFLLFAILVAVVAASFNSYGSNK